MEPQDDVRARRRATRERQRRRNRLIVAACVGAAALVVVGIATSLTLGDSGSPSSSAQAAGTSAPMTDDMGGMDTAGGVAASAPAAAKPKPATRVPSYRLAAHKVGQLNSPVQNAAGADLGGSSALLIAGLTESDTSRPDIVKVHGGRETVLGTLPLAIHDTAAVTIGGTVYLFGGGDGSAQHDQIWRINPSTGGVASAGHLPAPSSDQSAALIGSTAYIVGGYTGSTWLRTIVAWSPGKAARVVGQLPIALRYAAVAAAGGKLIIAGGTQPDGSATSTVYSFDPGSGGLSAIGKLPAPTTHAAGASIGTTAYVIGGRGSILNTPTTRIVAIDPATRKIRAAGTLSTPLSDLSAVGQGDFILLAGGRGPGGTVATLTHLQQAGSAPVAKASATASPARFPMQPGNVYAYDGPNEFSPNVKGALYRVYVPNSSSNTVDVINPKTYKVIDHFAVGALPQHVVPSWDLRRIYVTNDKGNTLTPINPKTGKRGTDIAVTDPYNLYFTPNGRFAIVVAEAQARLDFRNPQTMALDHSIQVPCRGIDHMDFSADGTYLIASCEFSGQVLKVDLQKGLIVGALTLGSSSNMPQDVKLSPDGRVFYVADMRADGVWKVNGRTMRNIGFIKTGKGAHGLYPSRDAKVLYVSNRDEGTISVISFATQRVVAKWSIPGGGTPDMGGVSPDGKELWLTGRSSSCVYVINTRNGHLIAKIPVGTGPHGLLVWPQPGRYSLGHTGILR